MTSRIWADGPTGNTPLTAAMMNGIEADLDARVQKGDLVYNVRNYGAMNNATSPTATLAGINNAIAAAMATSGNAAVYFPSGTYTVNGTIPITANVKIFGAGDSVTTLQMDNGTNADLFQIATAVTGFDLRDIHLYGNKANNTSGNGVNFLDDTGSGYLGSGRLSKVHVDSFAGNGVRLGTHRNTAYFDSIICGGNGSYGIYVGQDSQDSLFVSPNLGSNTLAGLYLNGSNNTLTGGTIYGGTNLIVEDTRVSKFICTGTVLEGCNQDGIVINTSSTDDVNTHQYIGFTMGRIGLTAPASYSAFKSTTAARIIASGHVYKKSTDTAPAYIFNVPAACVVNMAGLSVQTGAYGTALSANGVSAFLGYNQTTETLAVTNTSASVTMTGQAFTTMPLPTVTSDSAAGYSTATNLYTVPVAGVYAVSGKIRLNDGIASGVNCSLAVATSTADAVDAEWITAGANRVTLAYDAVKQFSKGDQVRLVYYLDTAAAITAKYARLDLTLISAT